MQNPDKGRLATHLNAITGSRTPGLSDEHLQKVFQYIKETLGDFGYEIGLHPFRAVDGTFENIVARKTGARSPKRIIVGAHFDSVPQSPGADDNASGVAAMLELAWILKDHSWRHMVEFIGFNLEEWYMLGSQAYVNDLTAKGAEVLGMISLEMVGYTSQAPKSQKMPPGFGSFYPAVGDFIGVVGNGRSRKLANLFKEHMKRVDGLPVESLVLPFDGWVLPATRLSDHSPFWDAGYPALLITDTSFYRNPHYHSASDTIDTLDLDFMVKVTEGIRQALIQLDSV